MRFSTIGPGWVVCRAYNTSGVSAREFHVQQANFSVQFCVRKFSGIVQRLRMFDYMANPVRRLIGFRGRWGPARRKGAMLLLRA